MRRLGVIGLSEGNGHPFSFSAIVNGYDRDRFAAAGWQVILDYLTRQPREAFGFADTRVTHAWTQDRETTDKLCAACRIDHALDRIDEMVGEVDAVLIARDDWDVHHAMAMPFLERGTPVFVDKPLTLDEGELAAFMPHLEAGRLMSTSGFRYGGEIEGLRGHLPELGDVRLVFAAVLNGLDKYGVHMLDAAAGLGLAPPVSVTRIPANHEAFAIMLADGVVLHLHCLGAVGKTFRFSVYGAHGHRHVDLHDNFTAFRNTIARFLKMAGEGKPPFPPGDVARTMTLIGNARKLAVGDTFHL